MEGTTGMRSDFYGLPWAAQQAIRRGEREARSARRRAWTIQELQDRVDQLQKSLGKLVEHAHGITDRGPEGMGWKSDELVADLAEAEALLK